MDSDNSILKKALRDAVRIVDPMAFYGPGGIESYSELEEVAWPLVLKASSPRIKNLAEAVEKFQLWNLKYIREYFGIADIVAVIALFNLDNSDEELPLEKIIGGEDDEEIMSNRQIRIACQPTDCLEISLIRIMQAIGRAIKQSNPASELECRFIEFLKSLPKQEDYHPGYLKEMAEERRN